MPDLVTWITEHEPLFRKSRLPSLYSDLSVQKTTNPEGYAANVQAWQAALSRTVVTGRLSSESKLTIQTSDELLNTLASPQYGRPSGLGLVFDESVKDGKMIQLSEFESAEQSIYHRTWIPGPLAILKWGLKQAGLTGNVSYNQSGRLRSGQFVVVAALEEKFRQINAAQMEQGHTLTDRVMTRDAFRDYLARLNNDSLFSEEDTEVLLRYLARDKGILAYDRKIVKFKSTSTETAEAITGEDTTIANLKSLIASLESQTKNLRAQIEASQKEARSAVEGKNKTGALSALRSKKRTEAALQQRIGTLTQLEEVYSKIEQAVDQVQIVEVMQSSVTVLKGLNKKIGGVERVEDVVEELREEMGKVDEVGRVMQEPLGDQAVLDEAEVDDELEAMEQEERRKEEDRTAEATRKRLAELESTGGQNGQKGQQEAQAEKEEQERKLRESIEGLEQMKIGGLVDEGAKDKRAETREQEQEQIPEREAA